MFLRSPFDRFYSPRDSGDNQVRVVLTYRSGSALQLRRGDEKFRPELLGIHRDNIVIKMTLTLLLLFIIFLVKLGYIRII